MSMLIIIIQTTIFWLIGWLIYELVLSKETFHQWNRIYLFAVIAIGLEVPFLEIISPIASMPTYVLPVTTIMAAGANQLPEIQVSPNTIWNWEDILLGIYILGVLVSAFLFLWELWLLYRVYKLSTKKSCKTYTWVEALSVTTPFSFWHLLFWNHAPDQPEHRYVLKHELAHIQQWHSLDKLFLQLMSIVLWWHPMVYLFKRSFGQLHEFLADRAATQQGNKKEYGQLLLQYAATHKNPTWIGNTFIQSPIKKRILMLVQPMSSKKNLWKYLAVLPLLAVVVFACQQESVITPAKEITKANERSVSMDTVITFNPETGETTINLVASDIIEDALIKGEEQRFGATENVNSTFTENDLNSVEAIEKGDYSVDTIITFDADTYEETMSIVKTPFYRKVDQMPVFGLSNCKGIIGEESRLCSNKFLITYLSEEIKYPKLAKENGIEGKPVVQFVIRTDGMVTDINIVRSVSPEIDAEVRRVVGAMPQWQAGSLDGKPVDVLFTLPVNFKL